MASSRPAWLAKDLASILGLDEESIKEMVVPDLESYTHEARLRIHLQDFLGASPSAKSFTSRYLSLRFPSLTNTHSVPSPSQTPDPHLLKPQPQAKLGAGSNKGKGPNESKSVPVSRIDSRSASGSGSARQSKTPSGRNQTQTQTQSIPDALNAAFGPGGKIYQKNRDVDDTWGRPSSTGGHSRSGGGGGGGGGSGSQTPISAVPSQRLRQPGAVNIHIQEPKSQPLPSSQAQLQNPARLDNGSPYLSPSVGGANGSASGSRSSSSKGKDRGEKIWDKPKSKEVKKLETLKDRLRAVREGEGKVKMDEGINCFCQARVHTLSTYTPLCQSCGLTICSLHPAYLPCPSCAHPLSTPAQLARLILRIEGEIEAQLAAEERQRVEAEQERLQRLAAEAGGGAFPTLSGGARGGATPAVGVGAGGRKVLTIGGGGKGKGKGKSTITTTTYRPTPSASASASGSRATTPPPSDIIPRLRSEPVSDGKVEKELRKLLSWREEVDRPFGDLKADKKGEGWKYRELELAHVRMDGDGDGRRRKARIRRGEGGREVPGAGIAAA